MKHGSTLFLKVVIYLLGLGVLGLCIIIGGVIFGGSPGMFLPILAGVFATTLPFFFALYNGYLLLSYVDANTAFSERSVRAIHRIKICAFTISLLYALMLPYIVYLAEIDDAPGAVLVGLVLTLVPLIVAVFAAVLQKLLRSAMDLKSENDLTV